jgi:hypothetical protein
MPAVKHLHQQSASNTKPEYIMGHSLQAISLLVHAPGGQVAAVPLTSRIHEGLVFSNRDARSLLDKLVALLLSIARGWGRQVLLVADAYYASAKALTLIGIDPGLLSETDPPNLGDCARLRWSQGSARQLGQDGSASSRSRRSKMNSRLFRAALSTFCGSPTQWPRGGAWSAG